MINIGIKAVIKERGKTRPVEPRLLLMEIND